MNLLFFVLAFALGGLLIAGISGYIFIRNVIQERKRWILLLKEQNLLTHLFEDFNLQGKMEALADEKLDHLVMNFKAKVPMVGVFLVGDLETTLKQLAKQELLSMVPEIEKNMMRNAEQEDLYEKIEKRFSSIDCKKVCALLSRLLTPSLLIGAVLGALFGLILFFFRPN